MSSVWEFVKRHRGKLVTGTVIAGGAYVAKKVYDENKQQIHSFIENATQQSSVSSFTIQTRKHYIFDSQQRTCDDSVLQLIPDLKTRLIEKFNVEALVSNLRDDQADLSRDQKMHLWNEMKVLSVCRLLAASYAYSILLVTLKIQVSILASIILLDSERSRNKMEATNYMNNKFTSLYNSFWTSLGYEKSSNSSETSSTHPSPSHPHVVSASAQQLFLQCAQYFITCGSQSLWDRVQKAAYDKMNTVPLNQMMSSTDLSEMISEIRDNINENQTIFQNVSFLVVPTAANDSSDLSSLLHRLQNWLNSPQCAATLSNCVDRFHKQIVGRVCGSQWDAAPPKLAKLVPLLTDGLDTLSSVEFDSPVQELLISNEVHQLCVNVFNETDVVTVGV